MILHSDYDLSAASLILKTAIYPRTTLNKSVCCIIIEHG